MKQVIVLVLGIVLSTTVYADEARVLPQPELEKGRPLMQALKLRESRRAMKADALPEQEVSNLLWAAWGVNREDGKRTAPSTMNWQEITVYIALPDGVYIYDAEKHALLPHLSEDIRGLCGKQGFVATAPIVFILVADSDKTEPTMSEKDRDSYMAIDAGFISQNLYLYCASEGLATVVIGWVEKEPLAAKLGLKKQQKIIVTQPVGLPAEEGM